MDNAKKRVLVVDDEPRILRFIRAALTAAGYDVISTTSGEEALQMVRAEKPDIVLLDIVMMPVSGFDVLSQLRTFSALPVIAFSAQSSTVDKALRLGANDFIAKPFNPGELTVRIRTILADRSAGT